MGKDLLHILKYSDAALKDYGVAIKHYGVTKNNTLASFQRRNRTICSEVPLIAKHVTIG